MKKLEKKYEEDLKNHYRIHSIVCQASSNTFIELKVGAAKKKSNQKEQKLIKIGKQFQRKLFEEQINKLIGKSTYKASSSLIDSNKQQNHQGRTGYQNIIYQKSMETQIAKMFPTYSKDLRSESVSTRPTSTGRYSQQSKLLNSNQQYPQDQFQTFKTETKYIPKTIEMGSLTERPNTETFTIPQQFDQVTPQFQQNFTDFTSKEKQQKRNSFHITKHLISTTNDENYNLKIQKEKENIQNDTELQEIQFTFEGNQGQKANIINSQDLVKTYTILKKKIEKPRNRTANQYEKHINKFQQIQDKCNFQIRNLRQLEGSLRNQEVSLTKRYKQMNKQINLLDLMEAQAEGRKFRINMRQ